MAELEILPVGTAVTIRSNEKMPVFQPYRPDEVARKRTAAFREQFGFDFAPEIGERTHAGRTRRLRNGELGRITAVESFKDKTMYWVRLGSGSDEVRLYPRQLIKVTS